MKEELFLNGELKVTRKETHRKIRQPKSIPVFTSRMERREYYKSANYFDIRNVLDVKGFLKDISDNWNTYVSKVHQWIQKNPAKRLVVTGIFTIVLGFFGNTSNAGCIEEYTYQVKSGEKIEEIAAKHGVTAQEILDANGLSSIEGKKILLPKVQDRMVNATILNVRSQPNTTSSILGKFKEGDFVKVVSVENGWAAILIKGRLCYVSADYLTFKESVEPTPSKITKTMYVTATSLRVREAASTSSTIIGLLKFNDRVSVTTTINGWAKITFNGKEAFVSASYLTKNEPTTSQITKTQYVTATTLRVREAASTSSTILGTLKLNDRISVKSTTNGWAKITFNGKEAFVNETYLTNDEPRKNMNETVKNTNTYVIKSGDTFTKIAKALGVSVSFIQDLNLGVDSSKLKIGQIIKVPYNPESTINQIQIAATLAEVDPQGTFRFITPNGTTYTAKALDNMKSELFNYKGKNVTLTLEGNRGQLMTLVSLQ
ncbi:SH3 domain-containing protein [Bacillus sp. JJ1764]|uniref:SH3 domain-containing protein n=1 Tax=Bacillus sp. JJ1764 TaxID=3122964 RepID=UPI002FFE861F